MKEPPETLQESTGLWVVSAVPEYGEVHFTDVDGEALLPPMNYKNNWQAAQVVGYLSVLQGHFGSEPFNRTDLLQTRTYANDGAQLPAAKAVVSLGRQMPDMVARLDWPGGTWLCQLGKLILYERKPTDDERAVRRQVRSERARRSWADRRG